MHYHTILYSKKNHLARLTLNRPAAGNAVDSAMDGELAELCRNINQDDDVYVVVITGAGKDFCRGVEEDSSVIYRPAASISTIDCPVIAAINGDALGIGLEMALSCDIRIAATSARFAMPQVASGFIPADGGTQRLPRIVGPGNALEMLLTAATITADRAREIGLLSAVVPPDALEAQTRKLAETIAARAPLALRYLKEAAIKGLDMTLEQGLRLEADLYFLLHTTADRTEGVTAFREKRNPEFKGK